MGYSFSEIKGDIVKCDADFLVNASNTNLKLGSGVSMSFKRHCGAGLQKEMDDIKKQANLAELQVKQGDVLATSSGESTNFKFSLHAIVMDYSTSVSQKDAKPTLQIIQNILLNTEPYIDWLWCIRQQQVSIVFPYLGCGVGGLDKHEVRKVFEAFVQRDVEFECEVKLCELD
jgi:O-acetyl-ADP-ribose deacetylase (regulator of RNase III)